MDWFFIIGLCGFLIVITALIKDKKLFDKW